MPSLLHTVLTPLRSSEIKKELPGTLLDRAAFLVKPLHREAHFAAAGSAEEDIAFKKLVLAYQLVFRNSLRGEKGWRTRAGRHEPSCERLARSEAGYYTGLCGDMMKAQESRVESEVAVNARGAERTASTEQGRRVRRATRLSSRALYGKAAKALDQCATLYPASPAVQTKLRALPTPVDPVSIIPEKDLPPKPKICPDRVHAAIKEINKESATGPDRAGVRWLLLVASNFRLFRAAAPYLRRQEDHRGRLFRAHPPSPLSSQPHPPRQERGQSPTYSRWHRPPATLHEVAHSGRRGRGQ